MGLPALSTISICAGGAGLDLALELAIPTARAACLVEIEAFAIAHLVAAMRAGRLRQAPIWSNARTFDGRPWRGLVDGVIGGIPCQAHSHAGRKLGRLDERDLWSPTRRIIVQCRPWFVWIENVGGMLTAGADEVAGAERVRRDLRKLGFKVEGGLFTAAEVGASHDRERIFILAVHEGLADAFRRGYGGLPDGAGRFAIERAPAEGAGGRADGKLADADCNGHEGPIAVGSPAAIGRRLGDAGGALVDAGGPGLQGRELGGSPRGVDGIPASRPAPELRRTRLGDADSERREEERSASEDGRGLAAVDGTGRALVDAQGVGRGEGRSQPAVRGGRSASAGASGAVADAGRGSDQRPGGAGDLPRAAGGGEGKAHQRQRVRSPAGDGDEALGDSARERGGEVPEQPRRQDETDADADWPGDGWRPDELPLFVPGPSDRAGWAEILERAPFLEPSFRRGSDELAPGLDAARLDRLRMLGNGVLPLQGAFAFRSLAYEHHKHGRSLLWELCEH